ncbi:Transposase DDE domain protein [Heliorestis convoluta]|uniref:Transposase DDE domain protein n=2 Tax=Heliorestis convoluta TaxID=356322 RepID=A0A5Q2N669_9FIRM|nr:Transposase DDE domain protein [Heliorestis convoluta]
MTFNDLILFILNYVKKTLQLELDLYFEKIKGVEYTITKQGFSQARQKVSHEAFVKMGDNIITWYYGDDDFKKFNGYRLSSIDASILEVHNSEELRKAFGYAEGKDVKLARAKASCIYDIENDMILASEITKYTTGEREIAIKLIEKLKTLGLKNDLILFDRGYPSKDFIAYLESSKIKYLMRVKVNSMTEFNLAQEPDQIIEIMVKGKPIKVRLLRFMLDSEIEEVLVTNLFDESLGIQEFKSLYFKRWGIEVKFDELKNKLQLQNFTGETELAVKQDFYASMYLANMAALAKNEVNEEITQKNEDKDLKYKYQVNINILIGKLKDSLVLMLLEDNTEKRTAMFRKIMDELHRNVVPIRPGRSSPRNMRGNANKNTMNKKRSL